MPKKRNEVTGKAVASIAGRILEALKPHKSTDFVHLGLNGVDYVTVGELKALAASALTQREDKPRGSIVRRSDLDSCTSNFDIPKRKPARKGRK